MYAKQQRWSDTSRCLAELLLSVNPGTNRRLDDLTRSLTSTLDGSAELAITVPLLDECRQAVRARVWDGDWLSAELDSRYGDALRRQGPDKFESARSLLETAANEVLKAVGKPAWGLPAARKRVADLYIAWKRPEEAAKWK